MSTPQPANAAVLIDDLMEQAVGALEMASYLEAEVLAHRALQRALEARDYERMSRICLPLQEARRQKMQLAQDAGAVTVLEAAALKTGLRSAGMYLVQPPMTAADARALRMNADHAGVPVIVLAREPMSRSGARTGKWPIAAVGPSFGAAWGGRDLTIRAYIDPPPGVTPTDNGATRDVLTQKVPVQWFLGACEALGDAAIARMKPEDPAAHQVEDLFELAGAWPLHEKLHQRLADSCRAAMIEPAATSERRRGAAENPWVF